MTINSRNLCHWSFQFSYAVHEFVWGQVNRVFAGFSDEDRHEEHRYGHNVTCNDACFNKVFSKLASDRLSTSERRETCSALHSIGGSLMYSLLCRNILSDIHDHRVVADKGGTSYRELLCCIVPMWGCWTSCTPSLRRLGYICLCVKRVFFGAWQQFWPDILPNAIYDSCGWTWTGKTWPS